jgi:CRISPR-associated protein Csd2
MSSIKYRYDFVLLFDVVNGNPNGDPDAGNLPRFDPETGHGLVTDVCLKRKIRNFVTLTRNGQPSYDIYVKEKAILNDVHDKAYASLRIDTTGTKEGKRKGNGDEVNRARDWMCRNFYDVRTFGAVMSTGTNCGQVRGPVQLAFARSIDPVLTSEHVITRMAVTTQKEAEQQQGDNRTMGRKYAVPYGLYRAHGFISAHLAQQTGFSEDDLKLLWQALSGMFEHDRSATRGEMATRGLYVFKHDGELGNAPAHALFEHIQVMCRSDVKAPRSFADYAVSVNAKDLPATIKLQRLVENGSVVLAA